MLADPELVGRLGECIAQKTVSWGKLWNIEFKDTKVIKGNINSNPYWIALSHFLSKPPTKNYVHNMSYPFMRKKYQSIWLFCPVTFQGEEVLLIPPQIHVHISEYQEQISRCLKKVWYYHIYTDLRPSTNKCQTRALLRLETEKAKICWRS